MGNHRDLDDTLLFKLETAKNCNDSLTSWPADLANGQRGFYGLLNDA